MSGSGLSELWGLCVNRDANPFYADANTNTGTNA
jgi:hypothetical protein